MNIETAFKALRRGLLILSACSAGATPVPQTIPMTNTFESYVQGTAVTSLTNDGWNASSNTVIVQTNVVWTDSKSVMLPENTTASNAIAAATLTNVWTDFNVLMTPHSASDNQPLDSNAVSMVYLSADGYLMAYDRSVSAWGTYTNTVWHSNVVALTNGQWAHVTIHQNYQANRCAVFLNGLALKQELPFISNTTRCTSFKVIGGEAVTSYVDNVLITTSIPSSMSNDWNNDSFSDAQEIQTYGYIATLLHVGAGQFYSSIQTAFNAALPRDTVMVHDGTYPENVTISNTINMLTGGVFTIAGSLAINTGLAITSRVGFVCGSLSEGNGATFAVTGNLTATNITLNPASTLTVQGLLGASNITILGTSSLWAQGGITCTNLTIGTGVTVLLTNLNVVASHLIINPGGQLVVSNGTLSADGILLQGSFTVNDQWGLPQGRATLPFADDFENYQVNTMVNQLGFRGWGASDSSVVIETNRTYGGSTNAVDLAAFTAISNRLTSVTSQNVWTDFRGILAYSAEQELTDVRTNALVMAVMSSNGFLTVYNRTNASWEVCNSNVWQTPVSAVTNGQWIRLSVYNAFNTKQCAIFLNGVLMRAGFPFINTNATSCSTFDFINNNTNSACLDNVSIGYDIPATLTNDVNGNGVSDAREIVPLGNFGASGSVYLLR